MSHRQQIWLRIGIVLLVILISAGILLFADQLYALSHYGYAGVFLLSMAANATLVLPAPGWLISVAAGSTLNPFWVGIFAGAGQALGELTGYAAGASGSVALKERRRYQKMHDLAQRYGLWIFTVLGFLPNPLFDIAGLTAGMLRIPVLHFLAATFVGKTLRAMLLAYGGASVLGHWLGR
ncbi:MAG: VTT domain-containing protein [Chloroflexi bacterium]|nr:VTT domain-containing protein [Chloroflexota bacterium]